MTATNEPSDQELIQAYLNGNQDGFAILYERYRKPLYGYLNKMLPGQHATVDDLYQQAWLKAIDNLAKYEHRQQFFAWLVRIAHNTAIDHFRRSRKHETVDLDEGEFAATGDAPYGRLTSAELAQAVAKAVGELPEEQREVFMLRQNNVSFKEIASLQDCSINTALGRMHYAVNKLRQILHDWQ